MSATHYVRINYGVLAAAEKRLLVWIAQRLPAWVDSDHLTLLPLLSAGGTGLAFWVSRYWPPALIGVVAALVLKWFGDSLDGTLARVRRRERPRYGFYVDHVLDIAGSRSCRRVRRVGGPDDVRAVSCRAVAREAPEEDSMTRRTLAAAAMFLLLVSAPARSTAATLEGGTLAAWNVYVAATEARIASELRASRGFLTTDFGERGESVRKTVKEGGIDVSAQRTRNRQGSAIAVPDGLISHWRGSVFLPGARLASLLDRVQHPSETGPHQEDVLALRVLDRGDNWLKLYIRMTRTKIVTVTYDTEHQVSYRRHSPDHVSSQSIATKIAEIEGAGTARESAKPQGQDRGFLWRMNSYWRYEQVPGGVIVELESLTLSRSIPLGLGVVVQPIIDNIAEESMTRTLDNLRTSYTSSSRTLAAVRQ